MTVNWLNVKELFRRTYWWRGGATGRPIALDLRSAGRGFKLQILLWALEVIT